MDLVISVGIFIIYILSVFILFKPGVQEEYNPDHLNTIVEQNLKNEIYYSIEKIPLYLKTPVYIYGDYAQVIFPFPDWTETETYLYDETLTKLDYKFVEGFYKDIQINYPFSGGQTYTFWINRIKGGTNWNYNFIPANRALASAKYGVTETIYGISQVKLDNLEDYETLKNNWNFPKSKDFKINIKDLNPTPTINKKINWDATPPREAKVSVLRWNDLILKETSETTQVIIEIRTW